MKALLRFLSIMGILMSIILLYYIDWSNPDMTNKRLLIENWDKFLIIMAIYCGAELLNRLSKKF